MQYINEESKFWKHSYKVRLAYIGEPMLVNADNEQEALDYAVDHAEKMGWVGYFLSEEDIERDEQGNEIDVIRAGNHCLALPTEEVHIEQLD